MTKEEFIKKWEFHSRLNWNHIDSNLKEELSNDYDAIAKIFLQPDVIKSVCDHPFASVMSKCNGEINHCLKCGEHI